MIILKISTNNPKDTDAIGSHLMSAFMSGGSYGQYASEYSAGKKILTLLLNSTVESAKGILSEYFEKIAPGVVLVEGQTEGKLTDYFSQKLAKAWDSKAKSVEGAVSLGLR